MAKLPFNIVQAPAPNRYQQRLNMVTQREIAAAYHRGEDIMELYNRRVRTYAIMGVIVAAPVAFIGLYIIKSALGINLFDFHLWDLL